MQLDFVPARESDKAYLLTLRMQTMVDHLERAGLHLSEQEHLERVNYKFEHTYLLSLNDVRVGAIKYESSADNVNIIQVQIDPEFQGKGFGSIAIKQLISSEKNKTISLSVLKDNPAKELYTRLGFFVTGEDDDEYHMRYDSVR